LFERNTNPLISIVRLRTVTGTRSLCSKPYISKRRLAADEGLPNIGIAASRPYQSMN